jgi:hypothetical protein
VLIPAIELARFYGCMSSVLARELFAGGWPKLEYLPHSNDEVIDGRAKIGVDNIRRMDRLSAVAIARYKFSAAMRRQVDRAGQALSYAARRSDPFRFGFPFDHPGQTAKIVCNVVDFHKWNWQSTTYEPHYLVTQIIMCYQPLPFEELEVEFRVSAEQRPVDDPALLKPIGIGSRPRSPPGGDTTPIDGLKVAPLDPTSVSIEPAMPNAIAEVTPFVDQQNRFATLDYSKVSLVSRKTEQSFRSARKPAVAGGLADGVSTNPGKGSKGAMTEAEVNTNTTEPIASEPVTLKSFQDALKLLRTDREFSKIIEKVSTQISKNELQLLSGNVFVIPLRKLAKTHSKWYGTSTGSDRATASKSRSRVLLLAHVVFRNGAQYLIGEIERVKEGDRYSIFCAQIPVAALESFDDLAMRIAKEVAHLHGWPKLDLAKSVYVLGKTTIPARRLFHSGSITSAKEYARRIAGLETGL